ncbi:hypothetical protein AHAS_Ahas09G0149400 [Arachis hypogaea]
MFELMTLCQLAIVTRMNLIYMYLWCAKLKLTQLNRQMHQVIQVIPQVSEGRSHEDYRTEQAIVILLDLVRQTVKVVCRCKNA